MVAQYAFRSILRIQEKVDVVENKQKVGVELRKEFEPFHDQGYQP
jgi:hypothetical protein